MTNREIWHEILFTICCGISIRGAAEENWWPTHGWRTSTPEAQGIDSNVLADALGAIRDRKMPIHSLLIERNGYVILDAYFFPFKDGETHDIASATKSVTSMLEGSGVMKFSATDFTPRAFLSNKNTLPEIILARPGSGAAGRGVRCKRVRIGSRSC